MTQLLLTFDEHLSEYASFSRRGLLDPAHLRGPLHRPGLLPQTRDEDCDRQLGPHPQPARFA